MLRLHFLQIYSVKPTKLRLPHSPIPVTSLLVILYSPKCRISTIGWPQVNCSDQCSQISPLGISYCGAQQEYLEREAEHVELFWLLVLLSLGPLKGPIFVGLFCFNDHLRNAKRLFLFILGYKLMRQELSKQPCIVWFRNGDFWLAWLKVSDPHVPFPQFMLSWWKISDSSVNSPHQKKGLGMMREQLEKDCENGIERL